MARVFFARLAMKMSDLDVSRRIWTQLVRSESRRAQDANIVNQIRGLLAEYGLIIPQGRVHVRPWLAAILEDAENGLTTMIN